jgi:hypothetical protein
MTETADKLRKKIYNAAQTPGSTRGPRGEENYNPNKETIINNIQVSGDIKRDSV